MRLKVDGRLAQAESRADLQSNTCALYMADVVNSMMILTIFSRTLDRDVCRQFIQRSRTLLSLSWRCSQTFFEMTIVHPASLLRSKETRELAQTLYCSRYGVHLAHQWSAGDGYVGPTMTT